MGELLITVSHHSHSFSSYINSIIMEWRLLVFFFLLRVFQMVKNSESVSTDMMPWARKYILVPFLRLTYLLMSKNRIWRSFDIGDMPLLSLHNEVLVLPTAVMRFSR